MGTASRRSILELSSEIFDKTIEWVKQRLDRTSFVAVKINVPERFLSPLALLGVLTLVMFVVLGISGALLLFYYTPTFGGAYVSVVRINDDVTYGLMLRNIHYHASNAMVLLAVLHMFNYYFKARYKSVIRGELLWLTGIVLGIMTTVEAYTGYDLIFNERAALAINIGRALSYGTPVFGTILGQVLVGTGIQDLALRYYSLHIFIIPIMMLLLLGVHIPRIFILDIPVTAIMIGAILLLGGLFPVELGVKFEPTVPLGIVLPEWYLTGVYAFIRTGIHPWIAGALLPSLLFLAFSLVPFLDRDRTMTVKDRPFYTAMGVALICQIVITTVWGFRASDLFRPLKTESDLPIDPIIFYASLIILSAVSYVAVYGYYRWKAIQAKAVPRQPAPRKPRRALVSTREIIAIMLALISLQVFLNFTALQAHLSGIKNLVMIQAGTILIVFGMLFHAIRVYLKEPLFKKVLLQ